MSGIRLAPAGSQSARDRGCRCEERDGVVRTHPYCPFHTWAVTHPADSQAAQLARLSEAAQ